jgi:phosphatidate cytidylyltransferase
MNQDLKIRIPTAIGYVAVILACLFGGEISSLILLWIFYGLCLHEFVTIESKDNPNSLASQIPVYVINNMLLSITILEIPSEVWKGITAIGVLFFIINSIQVLRKARVLYTGKPLLLHSLLYLTIPFASVMWMVQYNPDFNKILIALFVLIWLSDAGAYFAGKAFGKNKLYPKISPGKTWEGMIGGGILTLLTGYITFKILGIYSFGFWMGLALLVWITAVTGDLAESAWKRQKGIKDSGTMLPGHGGFLDRLDSFIYSCPFVVLYIIIIFQSK